MKYKCQTNSRNFRIQIISKVLGPGVICLTTSCWKVTQQPYFNSAAGGNKNLWIYNICAGCCKMCCSMKKRRAGEGTDGEEEEEGEEDCCNQGWALLEVQTDAGCACGPWWSAVLLLSRQTIYTQNTDSLWARKRKLLHLLLFLLNQSMHHLGPSVHKTQQQKKNQKQMMPVFGCHWMLLSLLWRTLPQKFGATWGRDQRWDQRSTMQLGSIRSEAPLTGRDSDIINNRGASGWSLHMCTHGYTMTAGCCLSPYRGVAAMGEGSTTCLQMYKIIRKCIQPDIKKMCILMIHNQIIFPSEYDTQTINH